MHKAVYLSLGAPHLEYPAVEDALRAEGVEARMVHLAAFDRLDLDEIDLVNLRMCRWYPDHLSVLCYPERWQWRSGLHEPCDPS